MSVFFNKRKGGTTAWYFGFQVSRFEAYFCLALCNELYRSLSSQGDIGS